MGDGSSAVTFVLGDVVGSSRLWEKHPDEMPAVIGALSTIVDRAAADLAGTRPLEQGEGDSFVAAFERPIDAIGFALAVQHELAAATWPSGVDLAVRMAIHTGDVHREGARFLGAALNRCGRLRDLAHGGQVLVSSATAALVDDRLTADTSLRSLSTHRLRDLLQPERVFQLEHAGLATDFPPLRSLELVPNNLPVQVTSFVGRESELKLLRELIGSHRMTTLTGAGGAGKTRLAVQVAASVVEDFADGVWIVDLAPVEDGALVTSTVAGAIGVLEHRGQALEDAIEAHLRDRHALVVVDSCEHLLDESSELIERLLGQCPALIVVATSREPLGVEGEATYRVPSLGADSIDLFVDRARLARPTFRLDEATAPTVAAICERVDGLPLAIELAAARVRSLAPAQILTQLQHQLSLLASGRRSALARQRTLEASVGWSHDLLTEDERVLFRRLSVFSGWFTLDAAEDVAADDELDRWRVLDLLTALVDRSLLQPEDAGEHSRFRMLETIRFYARQRLVDAGELDVVRDRHVAHYLERAESLAPGLLGPDVARVIDLLDEDLDNYRTALDWLEERGDDETFLRFGVVLGFLWAFRRHGEGMRRVQRVLEIDAISISWVLLASWLFELEFYGDFNRILDVTRRMEDFASRTGSALAAGRALNHLGWATRFAGEGPHMAIEHLEAAIPLLEEACDTWYLCDALWGASDVRRACGDLALGEAYAQRALALARSSGNPLLIGRSFAFTMTLSVVAGDLDRADAAYDEWLQWSGLAGGDPFISVWVEALRVRTLVLRGRFGEATEVARKNCEHEWLKTNPMMLAETLFAEQLGQFRSQAPGSDIDFVDEHALRSLSRARVAASFAMKAEHALASNDVDEARRLLECARAEKIPDGSDGRARVLLAAARIALAEGDLARGEDDAHEALRLSSTAGYRLLVVESLELVAAFAAAQESAIEAGRLIGAAEAMRARLSYPRPPVELVQHATTVDLVRAVIGDDGLAAARDEGGALDDEAAVAYASRGRGERRRPSSGWESLTPAEREVVALAAEGLRNVDIAARLFVSPATVKTHLSHVFAKLGVVSRAELAATVARRS